MYGERLNTEVENCEQRLTSGCGDCPCDDLVSARRHGRARARFEADSERRVLERCSFGV